MDSSYSRTWVSHAASSGSNFNAGLEFQNSSTFQRESTKVARFSPRLSRLTSQNEFRACTLLKRQEEVCRMTEIEPGITIQIVSVKRPGCPPEAVIPPLEILVPFLASRGASPRLCVASFVFPLLRHFSPTFRTPARRIARQVVPA